MAEDTARWLSRDATELAYRLAHDSDEAADCDVLIVGSGYGGAVAAARMAGCSVPAADGEQARPAKVWVVERGLEYLPGRFPRRFSELPGHVRFSAQDDRPARGRAEGLFDWRMGDQVHVLLANGLGGGSLINAGVMAQPDDTVFAAGLARRPHDRIDEARLRICPADAPAGAVAVVSEVRVR
jgi:cholesterol oxidase